MGKYSVHNVKLFLLSESCKKGTYSCPLGYCSILHFGQPKLKTGWLCTDIWNFPSLQPFRHIKLLKVPKAEGQGPVGHSSLEQTVKAWVCDLYLIHYVAFYGNHVPHFWWRYHFYGVACASWKDFCLEELRQMAHIEKQYLKAVQIWNIKFVQLCDRPLHPGTFRHLSFFIPNKITRESSVAAFHFL